MGNTTCCQGEHPDSNLEVDASVSVKPTRKGLGVFAELEAGLTIRGVGLKEAILLQAALRGYLARRFIASFANQFKVEREDVAEEIAEIPNDLIKLTKSVLAKADAFTRDSTDNHDNFEYGPVLFKDGSVYKGTWSKDSKRSGFGVQYWLNGTFYEGGWDDDSFSGKGRLVYENKNVYVGEFNSGKPNGKGKLTSPDGSYYTGGWIGGLKHGKGKERNANGWTYDGEYKNGMMDGFGLYEIQYEHETHTYEGDWKANKKSGVGKMVWNEHKEYNGQWADNLQHGEGYLTDGKMSKKGEWNCGRRVKWLAR